MGEGSAPGDLWWEEVKAKAAAKGLNEDCILPLGFLEPDSEDEEEDEEGGSGGKGPTLEQFRQLPVVICPRPSASKHFEDVAGQLGMVGRDDEDDPFRMLSTSHSYEGHAIIARHLAAIDRLRRKQDWPEAFTYMTALLKAAAQDGFWYEDTDDPDEVRSLVGKMERRWEKLLARSDSELGGVAAADRAAVAAARERLKGQVEQCC